MFDPFVKFPRVPKAPPGSKGGLIQQTNPGKVLFSSSDESVSKHDRLKGNGKGPQSVVPPKPAPDSGALPEEWFPQRESRRVTHD